MKEKFFLMFCRKKSQVIIFENIFSKLYFFLENVIQYDKVKKKVKRKTQLLQNAKINVTLRYILNEQDDDNVPNEQRLRDIKTRRYLDFSFY